MTMEFGTVCHRSSVLAMSLDSALKALTFGDGSRVNLVACSKDIRLDLVLNGIFLGILKTKLSYISLGTHAGLLEMCYYRIVHKLLSLVNITNRH